MEKPFFLLLVMLSCALMNIQTEQAGFPPDFGDPVRAVQDVSCVVYNWAWMNCSWSLGDYQHPEDIVVSLEWVCKGCKDQLKCPDPHQTYCRWPEIYGSPQYIFNITVQNNRTKDAEWTVLPIKSFDVIKPDPVELKVSDRNQSCVELQWSHSEVERIPDMVFGVNQTELPDGVTQTELPDGVTKVMHETNPMQQECLFCAAFPLTLHVWAQVWW